MSSTVGASGRSPRADSAYTVKTYRCGPSPGGGAGPPHPFSPKPLGHSRPPAGVTCSGTPPACGSIPVTSQWRNDPPGASGSSHINSNSTASGGTPTHSSDGDTLPASCACRSGITPRCSKSGLRSSIAPIVGATFRREPAGSAPTTRATGGGSSPSDSGRVRVTELVFAVAAMTPPSRTRHCDPDTRAAGICRYDAHPDSSDLSFALDERG